MFKLDTLVKVRLASSNKNKKLKSKNNYIKSGPYYQISLFIKNGFLKFLFLGYLIYIKR